MKKNFIRGFPQKIIFVICIYLLCFLFITMESRNNKPTLLSNASIVYKSDSESPFLKTITSRIQNHKESDELSVSNFYSKFYENPAIYTKAEKDVSNDEQVKKVLVNNNKTTEEKPQQDHAVSAVTNSDLTGAINVLDYGAVADGITDCTKAINSALSAGENGTVYFPSGTYVISGYVQIRSNTQIVGEGQDSVIMAAPGLSSGSTMLYINGVQNITIKNISISGNSTVNTRASGYSDKDGIHLLDIWNSSIISIVGCTFKDNIYAAIRNIGSSNVTVDTCNFLNVDCGFITLGEKDMENLTVENSYFNGHDWSEPISMFANALHTNITIINNRIENKIYATGIICAAKGRYNNVTIANNTVSNTAVGISINNATNVSIDSNKISNTTSGRGISIVTSDTVKVTNNYCTNTNLDGFYFENCSNTVMDSNTIEGFALKNVNFVGIRISGVNSSLTISNNTITKNELSISTNGIYVDGTGSIDINNNILNNCISFLESSSAGVNLLVGSESEFFNRGNNNVTISGSN